MRKTWSGIRVQSLVLSYFPRTNTVTNTVSVCMYTHKQPRSPVPYRETHASVIARSISLRFHLTQSHPVCHTFYCARGHLSKLGDYNEVIREFNVIEHLDDVLMFELAQNLKQILRVIGLRSSVGRLRRWEERTYWSSNPCSRYHRRGLWTVVYVIYAHAALLRFPWPQSLGEGSWCPAHSCRV